MQCPWIAWLSQDHWLDAEQVRKVEIIADSVESVGELSQLLVKNGFITAFQSQHLLNGTQDRLDCGRYRIRKLIGRGGMGEVYAAEPRDRRDVPVAIKTLQINMDHPEANRKRLELRFIREMKAGREVRHPNVTRTVDFGRHSDRLFLVMPRLKGPSLSGLIESKQRNLEFKTILRIAIQVVEGLEAIHKAGLVHRDLKPSNIVYDGYKRWMILDLGLAKALGDSQSLTRPGVILGTLDYASPEQLKDASKVSYAADFYALGCILFQATAGRVPFEGGDAVSKIYRHRMTPPEPLNMIRPDLPPEFTSLVNRLLAKEPDSRPDTQTILNTLRNLLHGSNQSNVIGQTARSDSFELPKTDQPLHGKKSSAMNLESDLEPASETYSNEISYEDLAQEWSVPSPELEARVRLVQQRDSQSRTSSRYQPQLALGLKIVIITILILSILFFFMSFRSFLDVILA